MYKLRADNTSVVVVMLDPPGPPRAQVLRRQKELQRGGSNTAKKPCNNTNAPPLPPKPCKQSKGLSIISRSVDFQKKILSPYFNVMEKSCKNTTYMATKFVKLTNQRMEVLSK